LNQIIAQRNYDFELLKVGLSSVFEHKNKNIQKSLISGYNIRNSVKSGSDEDQVSGTHDFINKKLLIHKMRLVIVLPPFPASFSSTQIVLTRIPINNPQFVQARQHVMMLG